MDESSLIVRASDAGMVLDAGAAVADLVDAGTLDAGVLVSGDNVDIAAIAKKAAESGHPRNWTITFIVISIIVVLTWGARKFGGMFIPFLKTDRGGALTVVLLGIAGGLLNSLAAVGKVSWDSVSEGIFFGVMSAGGFNIVKKVIFPSGPPAAEAAAPAAPKQG